MQIHPSQITPEESFDVFYFIRNHTDSTTYYVRGVVYDVQTGEILRTVDLDQSPTNSRLFIKRVTAPPDPSGYGRNIVAIATVYTDSGYTTKSDDYEEQEQYFLVKSSIKEIFGAGGGGVDYRQVREIVSDLLDEKLSALPKPEKVDIPEIPVVPFDVLFGAIGKLQQELNRVPKEQNDVLPYLDETSATLQEIKDGIQNLAEADQIDLSPLEDAIDVLPQAIDQKLRTSLRTFIDDYRRIMETMRKEFTDSVTGVMEKAAQDVMDRQDFAVPLSGFIQPKRKEPQVPDIRHLVS